jgi:hypothetical protein
MNYQKNSSQLVRAARMVVVLLAGIFLTASARAQTSPERFLFIFDTSAAMKKRLPAVDKAIDTMLALSLGGRLHYGDDVGVWTFDHELRTGEFPLQSWSPDNAATFAANLKTFLGKQRYANGTTFDALQPLLNQVVRSSERLTVLIFCDGQNEISWTPYDTGINQLFQQRQAERKKLNEPFVLVLRSQRGEFTGCVVGFPPDAINVPDFPPLPAPAPTPLPAPTNQPVVAPVVPTPSLIIIGTKVGTNLPPPEPTPAPVTNVVVIAATNPPPMQPQTNAPLMAPTNAATIAPILPPTKTNAVVSLQKSETSSGRSLVIGAILLAVAGALVILVLRRPGRADRSSLITRSMNQKK